MAQRKECPATVPVAGHYHQGLVSILHESRDIPVDRYVLYFTSSLKVV